VRLTIDAIVSRWMGKEHERTARFSPIDRIERRQYK
jgi:hypothetical protein